MMRFFISAICFLFVFMFETSFLSSLPSILSLTPLILGLSIYLLQSYGLIDGFIWMCVYGIFLNTFHFSTIPFVSLAWIMAGIVASVMARHVFSNRSFYGSVACAYCGFFALVLTESLLAWSAYFVRGSFIDWSDFFFTHLLRAFLLLLVMTVLFACTRRIRNLLPHPFPFRT